MAYVVGPSVNMTLVIRSTMKKSILSFKLISYEKNDSKFNISPTLSLKIMKLAPRNPLIESFLAIPRAHFSFPNFFDFILLKQN